ncbi:MAG: glycosyltransferase family 39 protein [Candidatus Levybacteria bacterium]|nr:glycosyltransferase family 39 protein [Candidatus Levybacteria bacterium]
MSKILTSIKRHFRFFIIGFFVLYFFLGIFIFRHYGISWDESTSRDNGLIVYQYITGQNSNLLTYRDRDYGTAFELPLVMIEKETNVTSSLQIYYLRHLLTFLFFFVGVVFFYKIALGRFGPGIAFLGVIFLVLSPRIFADSFYNTKDIGLLSGMIIAVFTLLSFTKKPSFTHVVFHSVACAFVVDIRLSALIILPITCGFFITDTFLLSARHLWRFRIVMLSLFLVLFFGFAVLFWPYLWNNPMGNFMIAFSNFSHFLRLGDTVFYLGNYIPDKYVPWHYPLVWIGVSTPLPYFTLFLLGVGFTVHKLSRNIFGFYKKNREGLIFLTWFFGPLIMVIGLNSTLYDGWRQLYFIYPAFLLVALIGLEGLLSYTKKRYLLKIVVLVVGIVSILNVLRFMTLNHPYQNLYFNELAGGLENAKQQFDLDYWGLTFREGLEHIASNDNSKTIPVFFAHGHKRNIDILPNDDKKRFVVVDSPQDAKYILSNYRWYKDRNNYRWDEYLYTTPHPKFYSVTVDGVEVMTVFKPAGGTL